jgi:hypothetical protein
MALLPHPPMHNTTPFPNPPNLLTARKQKPNNLHQVCR